MTLQKKVLLPIILCLLLVSGYGLTEKAYAASNPYPAWQNVDGDAYSEVPCTYFAWQQVYNNTGIALPAWGNAVNWWQNAKNAGYATGYTPQPGAIAVWSGDYYGHVAYVTSGSGNTFTVNEGGRTDLDHTSSNGVAYGYTLTNAVGGARPYDTNKILLGFIYPSQSSSNSSSITMSWGNYICTPRQTDAYIYVRATPSVSGTFTQVGAVIWNNYGSEVARKTETINTTYHYLNVWYNITEEMGIKLNCSTTYKYQYWVVFQGKKYVSAVNSFTTSGTHSYDRWKIINAATCTSRGTKQRTCVSCGYKQKVSYSDSSAHAKVTSRVSKATMKTDGRVITKCSACSKTVSTKTIYKASTIKLSTSKYTYDGKVKNPGVVVKDSKGNIINSSNYTIKKASGRKNVGQYTYVISFKDKYSGSKKVTFQILPQPTSLKSFGRSRKAFTVKWSKVSSQVTGYEILYARNSSFTKNKKSLKITNVKTTSKKITRLKAKNKYYVKIRTYRTVNGVKYYSSWSKPKTITTK